MRGDRLWGGSVDILGDRLNKKSGTIYCTGLGFSMKILNASEARAKFFSLVEQVNKDHLPRFITSRQGDAVLLSKSDWESIQETLYLQSIPNLVDSIRSAEQANDWVSEDEFLGALNGLED
ncbi:MAG: type II toxin-antitoxin system Phd/YefM family antitoxin [Pseudanabaenaceae cyanobacterium bins.39]|nr:type II toxin-antitoxin system Phd/YefM family antitoxin [Pseudanabaenaceae cyanobacterium bins.39]